MEGYVRGAGSPVRAELHRRTVCRHEAFWHRPDLFERPYHQSTSKTNVGVEEIISASPPWIVQDNGFTSNQRGELFVKNVFGMVLVVLFAKVPNTMLMARTPKRTEKVFVVAGCEIFSYLTWLFKSLKMESYFLLAIVAVLFPMLPPASSTFSWRTIVIQERRSSWGTKHKCSSWCWCCSLFPLLISKRTAAVSRRRSYHPPHRFVEQPPVCASLPLFYTRLESSTVYLILPFPLLLCCHHICFFSSVVLLSWLG